MRHPFPGPGLSINVLCSNGTMTDNDKEEFKKAQEEISKVQLEMFCEKCSENLEKYILPVKSVGVQGDFRTYRFPSVISFAKQKTDFIIFQKMGKT